SDQNLFFPTAVAVDSEGNLFVADSGNGRVLRFPKPLEVGQNFPRANLVLGQTNFTAKNNDPTQVTMRQPYGLAFAGENGLLVSDSALSRVLFFKGRSRDFTNGMAADNVFGQPNFNSFGVGPADNQMNNPHHIAADTDDRLYVADTANNRILIFNRAPTAGPNPRAGTILTNANQFSGLFSPRGIFVSPTTGEIWVTESAVTRLTRYPKFDELAISQNLGNYAIQTSGAALAITQDAFGNLLYADNTSRIAMHFPGVNSVNSANSMQNRALAPGAIATAYRQGVAFTEEPKVVESTPWPTELADVQVLINDKLAPMLYVYPDQLAYQVPMSTTPNGSAEMQVVRKSTGQILGAGSLSMDLASPGLFTQNSTGNGQLAALNEDNTLNTPTNQVAWGKVVTFYGTGQGFIPGAPADGEPATGPVNTPDKPRVFMGTRFVADEDVLYSGLAPGLVGVWQLNVKVPNTVVPALQVPVYVEMRSIASIAPPLRTWISVKQQ
ncbi:MAG: hypothetical protein ACRD8O_22035, partial [Bryobacteraceae bacterium]